MFRPKNRCKVSIIKIERIIYFLEKEGVELAKETVPELYVGILGKEAKAASYKLVNNLRNSGVVVETDYMDRSVKAQMKYANKINAEYLIVIGENEINTKKCKIKDMKTGKEIESKLDSISITDKIFEYEEL